KQQAVIAGYIHKEMENYGILHLTEAGSDFMDNPKSFMIIEMSDFSDADYASGAACSSAADPELFAILKDVRRSIASRTDIPPYVIFQDPTLEAMATSYPITEEEMMNIPGVGQAKTKRYGADFLNVIRRHVELNEIERPTDIKIRVVADKNKVRYQIIQGVDRKIDLEDLADARGLEFMELIEELESIVLSGTRIDIDYYLNEILDEDAREEILDYLRECEEDDLEATIQDLGDEFTEEEIRLMRVKFLSSW
ncbi:MAG: HRDC domain-containing protein, partial [Muribaculaceae bacterium]|nr:HRDC domain-containing protein [Muribaculaceae bacterium]